MKCVWRLPYCARHSAICALLVCSAAYCHNDHTKNWLWLQIYQMKPDRIKMDILNNMQHIQAASGFPQRIGRPTIGGRRFDSNHHRIWFGENRKKLKIPGKAIKHVSNCTIIIIIYDTIDCRKSNGIYTGLYNGNGIIYYISYIINVYNSRLLLLCMCVQCVCVIVSAAALKRMFGIS